MKLTLRTTASALAVVVAAGAIGAARPAAAQDAAAIRAIQQQILDLQAQLKKLQADAARRDAELKQAKEEAMQAKAQASKAAQAAVAAPAPAPAPALPPGAMVVTIPANDKDAAGKPVFNPNKPNGKFSLGGVTVALGGFVELDGVFRSRNETRGTTTSFTSIPFRNAADGHLSELRGSAQASRLSLLVQGNALESWAVSAYGEMDFNSSGTGSNSVQSNSYAPRLRQAYAQVDDKAAGLHLVAGQIWSLATPFKSGMNPRSEVVPATLDAAYVPGVTYLRVPELRLTKDFDGKYWVAIAADDPQTVFGGSTPSTLPGAATVATNNATLPGGANAAANIQTGAPGAGYLNSLQTYSYSAAPDIIGKVAADTSFGHFEAFGVARWFKDRVEFNSAAGSVNDVTHVTMGGGGGVSAFVPVVPGLVEVTGSAMLGSGIGRYGSGGLPDVTYAANGSLKTLVEEMGYIGVIGHPMPTVDLYTYAGIDQVESKTAVAAGKTIGYGRNIGSTVGCNIENSGAFATPLACNANIHRLSEITVGGWWRFLQGGFGTMQAGAQYGFIEKETFTTTGGRKTAPEHVVFAGLRYTPFQ